MYIISIIILNAVICAVASNEEQKKKKKEINCLQNVLYKRVMWNYLDFRLYNVCESIQNNTHCFIGNICFKNDKYNQ